MPLPHHIPLSCLRPCGPGPPGTRTLCSRNLQGRARESVRAFVPQSAGQAKASAGNTCSAITLGSWPQKFSPQRHILRAFPVSQLLQLGGTSAYNLGWRRFFTASWPPFPRLSPWLQVTASLLRRHHSSLQILQHF